jgi:hypothetical protein
MNQSGIALNRRQLLEALAFGASWTALGGLVEGCGTAKEAEGTPTVSNRWVIGGTRSFVVQRPFQDGSSIEFVRDGGIVGLIKGSSDVINYPVSAAFNEDGSGWVSDSGNHRILRFNANLEVTGIVDTIDSVKLVRPRGLALLKNGDLAISDSGVKRVAIYTPTTNAGRWAGVALRSILEAGKDFSWNGTTRVDVIDHMVDLGALADGGFLGLDRAAQRMVRFDSTYTPQQVIKVPPKTTAMTVDPKGRILIAEKVNRTIAALADFNASTWSTVFDAKSVGEVRKLCWTDRSRTDLGALVLSALPTTGAV